MISLKAVMLAIFKGQLRPGNYMVYSTCPKACRGEVEGNLA